MSAGASAQIVGSDAIVLRQSQTHQFSGKCPTGHSCQFELLPGHDSTSSVTADGLYTAPARVVRHGNVGGCPLLPHNSIYNMAVDGMPVHPNSDAFIAQLRDTSSYAYKNVHFYGPGMVTNPVSDNVPKTRIKTNYYPKWDGDYRLSTPPSADYGSRDNPTARIQTGWFVVHGFDNHYLAVNRDTCEVEEIYNPSAPSVAYTGCPNCTAGAAVVYPSMTFANADGIAGTGAGTAVAVGTWLSPLQLSQLELVTAVKQNNRAAVIPHALGVTVSNRALSRTAFAWPGTQVAYSGTGMVPYGSRLRLKQSFVDAYDPSLDSPNPAVQAYIMALLRTLQRYGLIIVDGTIPADGWGIHMRSERFDDSEVDAALFALTTSKRAANNLLINAMEVVDESGYRVSAASDVVRHPAANPETVAYRDTNTGAVLDVRDIAVHPPTIGSFRGQYNVVAGSGPVDLKESVVATGLADNAAITWTVGDGGGTVSTAGIYTPPETIAAATSFTVRAAAAEDPSVFVEIRVVVLPPVGSGLYLRNSSKRGNLVEGGRTWWSVDTNGKPINITEVKGYGDPWPSGGSALDPAQYRSSVYANAGSPGESVFSMRVPNGRYRLRLLVHTGQRANTGGSKVQVELNGAVVQPPIVFQDLAGKPGVGFPVDYGVMVENGELVIGWKPINAPAAEYAAAFALLPDTSDPHLEIAVAPREVVLNAKYQFAAAGYGTESAATWSVSPEIGAIDPATGLYAAPRNAYVEPQPITVTATPVRGDAKPASVVVQLAFGKLTLALPRAINRSATLAVAAQLNGAAFDRLTWTASPVGLMEGNVYRAPETLDADTEATITGTVAADPSRKVSAALTVRADPVPVRVAFGAAGACGFTDASTGNVWTCYAAYGTYKNSIDPGYTAGPKTTVADWSGSAAADFGLGAMNKLYQAGLRSMPAGSSWSYTIPSLPAGAYIVVLHFGHPVGKPAIQNIDINGTRVATDFKPAATALVAQQLKLPVRLDAAGSIVVRLADAGGSTDPTFYTLINGIEVLPVITQRPAVLSFAADPQFINFGDVATLSWTTSNASAVEIDSAIRAVPANGSFDVAPGETTDYTLTAANERGKATGSIRVYVHRDAGNREP